MWHDHVVDAAAGDNGGEDIDDGGDIFGGADEGFDDGEDDWDDGDGINYDGDGGCDDGGGIDADDISVGKKPLCLRPVHNLIWWPQPLFIRMKPDYRIYSKDRIRL